jgi:hypothetical protein
MSFSHPSRSPSREELIAEVKRLTAERDFAISAHDGQVQDKEYLAAKIERLQAENARLQRIIANLYR